MKEDFFLKIPNAGKKSFFKKRCSCNTFATILQILLVFIVINSYYQMEPTQNLQDKIERMSV